MSRALLARPRYEIVERKGLGHPDTISDAGMDAIAVALCRVRAHHQPHSASQKHRAGTV
ncbi:MAG: hypothetical protein HY268_20105 [Deltaproteobacteria bacterium]|nr:hypothetical protein [Deltaproteobacteria bacterium]